MEDFRRLSDKIILAHKQACEESNAEVASLLIQALEVDLTAIGGIEIDHREATEKLEAAFTLHEKLISDQME
tara:strand:+ start:71 stop:286 length:216 start_codon:yes stop_codon:yes gene_type:complete